MILKKEVCNGAIGLRRRPAYAAARWLSCAVVVGCWKKVVFGSEAETAYKWWSNHKRTFFIDLCMAADRLEEKGQE